MGQDPGGVGSGMDARNRAQNNKLNASPEEVWVERSSVERRSDQDKRSHVSSAHLIRGGRERRSSEDRRKSKERREGWLRLGRWRSVSIFDT
jgi:hypothetical protein